MRIPNICLVRYLGVQSAYADDGNTNRPERQDGGYSRPSCRQTRHHVAACTTRQAALLAEMSYGLLYVDRIDEITAFSATRSYCGGGVCITSGTTDHSQKVRPMQALPFGVENAV